MITFTSRTDNVLKLDRLVKAYRGRYVGNPYPLPSSNVVAFTVTFDESDDYAAFKREIERRPTREHVHNLSTYRRTFNRLKLRLRSALQ